MKVGAVCCRHQYVYGTSMYIKNILNREKSLLCGSDMFSFRILAPVA